MGIEEKNVGHKISYSFRYHPPLGRNDSFLLSLSAINELIYCGR